MLFSLHLKSQWKLDIRKEDLWKPLNGEHPAHKELLLWILYAPGRKKNSANPAMGMPSFPKLQMTRCQGSLA